MRCTSFAIHKVTVQFVCRFGRKSENAGPKSKLARVGVHENRRLRETLSGNSGSEYSALQPQRFEKSLPARKASSNRLYIESCKWNDGSGILIAVELRLRFTEPAEKGQFVDAFVPYTRVSALQ